MARVSMVVCALMGAVLLAQCAAALNCVLFHGVGQDGPGTGLAPGQIKTTSKNYLRPGVNMPEYWGDAGQRLEKAGCTNVFGYWTESAKFAWSDEAIQREYCAAIVAANADVIFTHSMGGPIIAGALHNNLKGCIDRIGQGATAKTHWYGLQSPLAGSEAADVLKDVCKNEIIAKFAGRCAQKPDGSWAISPAYASLLTTNCPPYLKDMARTYESGNMCGVLTQNVVVTPDRTVGLANVKVAAERVGMGLGLEFIRDAVNTAYVVKGLKLHPDWAANNLPSKSAAVPATGTDGMVGFSSCRTQPLSSYKKDPKSRFYAVEANHGDGRGTFGDDKDNVGFQPIQYMKNMVALTAATKKPNGEVLLMPRFSQHFVKLNAGAQTEAEAEDEDEADIEAEDEDEVEAEDQDEVEAEDEDEAEDEAEEEEAEEADF